MVDIMWEKLPTFGDPDKNPEVFVYYLQCRHDQKDRHWSNRNLGKLF